MDLLSNQALDGFEVVVEEALEAAFAVEVELRRLWKTPMAGRATRRLRGLIEELERERLV